MKKAIVWSVLGLTAVVLLIALGSWIKAEADKKKCDLAKIDDGLKCVTCNKILDQKKDLDKDGNCKKCKTAPIKVKVCVKVGYVCKDCGTQALKPGKCHKCEKELESLTVESEIIYKCPECGAVSDEPRKCESCEKELEKTCRNSGIFPHVPAE